MAFKRQNARLESFLKRALPLDKYERLRCYETAVIVSIDEKRALKHIILGHRTLYSTESPPKLLKTLLDLAEIDDVALVPDYPNFLSGTERENTHHIRIRYRRQSSGSSTPKSISSTPRGGSTSAPTSPYNRPRKISLEKAPRSPALQPSTLKSPGYGESVFSASSPASSPAASPRVGPLMHEGLLSLKGPGELDIYVLVKQSPLFMELQTAILNYQIEATVHFAQGYCTFRSPSKTESDETALFQQMKQQIFAAKSLERLYPLIQELKTACERFLSIRKQFWRTPDLLKFLLEQLEKALKSSSTSHVAYNQEDRLEFSVLVLETLAVTFRETEIAENRAELLANSRDLLFIYLTGLLLETDFSLVKQEAATKQSKETLEILDDLTDAATAVLFELSLASHHMAWQSTSQGSSSINICWLFSQIDSISQTKNFVKGLMRRVMQVLASVTQTTLTPTPSFPATRLILLYQQVYLLKMFLQYSSKTTLHIKETYAEEFRYYFKNPIIGQKLPPEYPLTAPTLRLIDDVVKRISTDSISK